MKFIDKKPYIVMTLVMQKSVFICLCEHFETLKHMYHFLLSDNMCGICMYVYGM